MWGVIGWFVVPAFFIVGICANLKITEKNLRQLLSESEWRALMETPHANYSITYPYLKSRRTRRSLHANPGLGFQHLVLNAPSLGRRFDLRLTPSPSLLAPGFAVFETFANGTQIVPHHLEDLSCYYRSETAALSLCGGVRGIVHVDADNSYLIHPLPSRFANKTDKPHLVIHKSHNEKDTYIDEVNCAHYSNPKDFKRYKKKFKSNTLMKTLPLPSLRKTKLPKSQSVENNVRVKRETPAADGPVFVETAVFVDRDLFDHMKTNYPIDTERELIRFILAMVNAVQLLYHDPSLGRQVNFVLKRLEILKEEATGLSRPPDIDMFLSSFCNWQRNKNPVGDQEPQHWDHAVILTGLDLYVRSKHGKISSQVVGLAPVAGMCTATSSCTVNEGRHFESVYVVAHEIGHNLGMRHDGPLSENDCDPSSYIMSPTLGSGKITWSACSRRYLQNFLETPQSGCLLDHGSSAGQLDHSAEGSLPGERFDADQQCILKYGSGSRHSTQQPLDDVCRDLHCERDRYTWTSHPALEGTMCGHGMWCRSGKCIIKGSPSSAAYVMSPGDSRRTEMVHGSWSPWKFSSDCASGCLFGEEGRLRSGSTGISVATRSCNNPRPQGGGSKCSGPDKKYQACNAKQCLNVPRLTIKEFADQICTRAKDVDKDLTGSGFQRRSSDYDEACTVWCQKRNGSTKSRGWTFPDGTACQIRRSRFSKANFCINGRCEEFVCDPYDDNSFVQLSELCPINREDNEIAWTNDIRRRDTGTHWSSASGCHFNCIFPGSGIRLVISKGNAMRSSIQLCQSDKFSCGRTKTSYQHASIVCKKYKERVRRLSGFGMQISAALEDPDRSCRVACQDDSISHRFYLVNGEEGWFPFGTDCSKGMTNKKSFCISGKCLEFGSDDTPLAENEFALPLLSRSRRSLHSNGTKVTAVLYDKELEDIVQRLNRTISGTMDVVENSHIPSAFDIDLTNPIHVNMDMTAESDSVPYYYVARKFNFYDYS